ncbi:MAG TPA: hypothetical protein VIM43_08880 [Rugosibacter sp.]
MKLIQRKFYRVLLCHMAGSICLVSLTATAQPSRFLELAGWSGDDRAMGLEADARVQDERSAKHGDGTPEYQPQERSARMSREDRLQLRRDVRDAGREIYPEERRGRHLGGRGGQRN